MARPSWISSKIFGMYKGLEDTLTDTVSTGNLNLTDMPGYDGFYAPNQAISYKPLKLMKGYNPERGSKLVKCLAKELGGLFSKAAIIPGENTDEKQVVTYKVKPTLMSMLDRGADTSEVKLTINKRDGTVNIEYKLTGEIYYGKTDAEGKYLVTDRPVSEKMIVSTLNRIYSGIARYGYGKNGLMFVDEIPRPAGAPGQPGAPPGQTPPAAPGQPSAPQGQTQAIAQNPIQGLADHLGALTEYVQNMRAEFGGQIARLRDMIPIGRHYVNRDPAVA